MTSSMYSGRIAGVIGLVLAAAAYGWITHQPSSVGTDNAYVKSAKYPLSSEVSALVKTVHVDANQAVEQGQLLVELDSTQFSLAVLQAEAALDQVVNDLGALRAEYAEAEEELLQAQQDVDFYQRQVERNARLDAVGVSEAVLDEAKQQLIRARSKTVLIRQKLSKLRAELGGEVDTPLQEHARVKVAQAELDQARYRVEQSKLYAPVAGFVGNQVPHRGQLVFPGMPLVTLFARNELWIEANFKETQLSGLAPGMQAEVVVDAYPDVHWRAEIESLSAASGSEFALIPAQNASGNWVKVVQRVPVRLRLSDVLSGPQLRSGMSAEVNVDIAAQKPL